MGLVVVAVTVATVRRGAFRPRIVVELRDDQRRDGVPQLTVVAAGIRATADVRVTDATGVQRATEPGAPLPDLGGIATVEVDLPAGRARELKVWAHGISPEGRAERLPAQASLRDGDGLRESELGASDGQAVLPLRHEPGQLDLRLLPESR
jgi:hypothetical protein